MRLSLCILGQEYHRSNVVLFLVNHMRRHINGVGPYQPHFVKVVYARFFHCKVIVFPFAINKYFSGKII